MKYFFFLFAGLLFLGSCSSEKKTEETAPPVKIIRFDKELMARQTPQALQALLLENPAYARSLYRAHSEDTAFVNHLFYIFHHPETVKFHNEVDVFYGDMSDLEAEFGKAFAKIKKEFPDFNYPKVVGTFTGLENDLYVSDSVVYIALESFVGPTATFRPDLPNYILNRYQKPYIVPTVVRFIADKYNQSDEADNTLLSDMLYFGKAFEFTKNMLPAGSDSLIIAYPDSSMHQVWNAQGTIWAYFLDNKLLYEQNNRIKEKYIGERPKVPEIGPSCPGRIGQWLGWRIVEAYLEENPEVTLPQLMKNTNAQEILTKSKYRGGIE